MIVDTSALIAILRDAPQNLPAERSGAATRKDCSNSSIRLNIE